MNGKAKLLERLAKAQRKEADNGHRDAAALRIRAQKNEAIAATLRKEEDS